MSLQAMERVTQEVDHLLTHRAVDHVETRHIVAATLAAMYKLELTKNDMYDLCWSCAGNEYSLVLVG